MVRRGMYDEPYNSSRNYHPDSDDPEGVIRKLAIEADALTHQQQFPLPL